MLTLLIWHLLRAQPHAVKVAAMTSTDIIDEPLTRDELLTALHNMNETAKAISRRGFVGLMSDEYKRRHASINDLLDQLAGK